MDVTAASATAHPPLAGMRCFLAFIFFSYKILLNSFVIIYLFGVGGWGE